MSISKSQNKPKPREVPEMNNVQLDISFARAFSTAEGSKVLEDLCLRFYDCPIRAGDINRAVGQRDVVHYIKQRVKRANA